MTHSKPRILIVGNKGMLGHDLTAVLSNDFELFGVDIGEMDITQSSQIASTLDSLKPQIIINSAAFTKVDDCETNKELANRINGEGVENLAKAASEKNIYLIHFSTDYVFDGVKKEGYVEDDKPAPINAYGRTKLAGESALSLRGVPYSGRRGNLISAPRPTVVTLNSFRGSASEPEQIIHKTNNIDIKSFFTK